jgi:hypothetical protein
MSDKTQEDLGITSIHIDERNRSVTITSRHEGLPNDAPAEWRERGFNSYEQTVVYSTVDGLDIDGWDYRPATTWTSTNLPDSRIAVTLTGPGTSVLFHADALPRHSRQGLLSGAF